MNGSYLDSQHRAEHAGDRIIRTLALRILTILADQFVYDSRTRCSPRDYATASTKNRRKVRPLEDNKNHHQQEPADEAARVSYA